LFDWSGTDAAPENDREKISSRLSSTVGTNWWRARKMPPIMWTRSPESNANIGDDLCELPMQPRPHTKPLPPNRVNLGTIRLEPKLIEPITETSSPTGGEQIRRGVQWSQDERNWPPQTGCHL
jgi:hypothetical protein